MQNILTVKNFNCCFVCIFASSDHIWSPTQCGDKFKTWLNNEEKADI